MRVDRGASVVMHCCTFGTRSPAVMQYRVKGEDRVVRVVITINELPRTIRCILLRTLLYFISQMVAEIEFLMMV